MALLHENLIITADSVAWVSQLIDYATNKMKEYLRETTTLNPNEISQMFEYKESFAEQTTKKLNKQSYLNQERVMESMFSKQSLDDGPVQVGVKRAMWSEFNLIGEGSDYWEDWSWVLKW